jgi:hypothetical protein
MPAAPTNQRVALLTESMARRLVARAGANAVGGDLVGQGRYDTIPAPLESPWFVYLTNPSGTWQWNCVDGSGLATLPAGRVWTREGNKLEVTASTANAISADSTICCVVTFAGAGSVTASLAALTGALDCWEDTATPNLIVRFPLALVTFTGGIPAVKPLRFGDLWLGDRAGATVAVQNGDVPAYLKDQFQDLNATAQYATGDDVLADLDVVDSAGDKKLRVFLDKDTAVDTAEVDLAPEIRLNGGYIQTRCKKVRLDVVSGKLILVASSNYGDWVNGPQTCA